MQTFLDAFSRRRPVSSVTPEGGRHLNLMGAARRVIDAGN